MDAFITRRGGGKSSEANIILRGIPDEKITITLNGVAIDVVTLDSSGDGNVIVKNAVRKDMTLTGSISGYSKTVNIVNNRMVIDVWPDGALYWYGRFFNDVTGDWIAKGKAYSSGTPIVGNISVTKHADRVYIKQTENTGTGVYYTSKKINLDGYNKLVLISSKGNGSWTQLCVWSSLGTYATQNIVASRSVSGTDSKDIYPLDLNEYGYDSYYIGFYLHHNTTQVNMYALYLE